MHLEVREGDHWRPIAVSHLTQFWNSSGRYAHPTLLVETANPRLIPALEMLSFRKTGTSNIGEDFYRTSIDQVDAVARAEFGKIKAALKQIESVPVHEGTAPVPANWYYQGWGAS